MDRRISGPYFLALLLAPVAAGLRLWSLAAAVDELGLPAMHISVWCLIAVGAVFLLLSLALAVRSPGRSGRRQVLHYGAGGFGCAAAAGALILLSSILDFARELSEGPVFTTVPLLLLGLAGGIGLMAAAWARKSPDRRMPGAEILPVVYFLIKLILCFKGWSTDPVILDYCVQLFGLIFVLLAFLRGAGFSLDQGKPRKTLFLSMGCVFFSAAAMMDGIAALRPDIILLFAGTLLWQLPLIWDLCVPASDPIREQNKTE